MVSNRFARTIQAVCHDLPQRISNWSLRAVLVGGLLAPNAAWSAETTAGKAPAESAKPSEKFAEDSILISTRKLEATEEVAPGKLEPISTHSDKEPELADPRPETTPPVAAKAAKAVKIAAISESKPVVESKPASPADAATFAEKPTKTSSERVIAKKKVDESAPVVAQDDKPAESEPAAQVDAQASKSPAVPSGDAPVVTDAVAAEGGETPEKTSEEAEPAAEVAEKPSRGSRLESARFHGIVPGTSTREQLVDAWGQPHTVATTKTGEVLSYDLPPFKAVDVLVEKDVVTLMRVKLDSQQEPERLARRLRLDAIVPVKISDEANETTVGVAYPEKGILLMLNVPPVSAPPSTPQVVTHMVIQALDAEAFALRADQAAYEAFSKRRTDLELALDINPEDAYANWRLAELHRLTGSANKATEAAEVALKTKPESDTYRLCLAQCLFEQGKYDQAVLETRKTLDSETAPAVVKAGALHLMGLLASKGDSVIADKAIGFHTLAIEIADGLAGSSDFRERHTAKRILVDAHLAIAREIARRKYDQKMEIVAQWISRASGLAEQMIADDDGSLELRLIVARESLATLASLKPTKDPGPFIKEAEATASQLLADSSDEMFRSRIGWQLGEAYFHALRIEHSRKEADSGLEYGRQALRNLQAAAVVGEIRPEAEALVGRLYFHIGAVHAVHKQDHAEAVTWYDKAYPLLTSEAPESELVVPRRQGEALVSMAVSYWTQGGKDRGVELTSIGAGLMEKAVAAGVLDEAALAVPYGNLSTMHKKLGNSGESTKFAKLARGARGATPSLAEAGTPAAPPKQAATPQRTATRLDRSGPQPEQPAAAPAPTSRPRTAVRVPSAADEPIAEVTESSSRSRSRRGSVRRGMMR